MWVPAEIQDEKETYKFEAHKPMKLTKRIPYLVCQHCGLVFIRNKVTSWCIKTGCNHSLHKDYKNNFK